MSTYRKKTKNNFHCLLKVHYGSLKHGASLGKLYEQIMMLRVGMACLTDMLNAGVCHFT